MKTLWSIAGHDPLGAAGIQVDLKVGLCLNVPVRTIIACFTAQNHHTMTLCEAVPDAWLRAQWESLRAAENPTAIKLGLISDVAALRTVGALLRELPDVPVICDPVLAASSGRAWDSQEVLAAYREFIFPRLTLLTPNRPEAEKFLGRPLITSDDYVSGAAELRSWGLKAVLIKGGHGDGHAAVDYFADEQRAFFLSSPRKPGHFRGTGCALSTALGCFLAQGLALREAIVKSHAFLHNALRPSASDTPQILEFHAGPAPLGRLSYAHYFPEAAFAPIDDIGFYPIVPNLEWLKRLLPTGIKTIQLRLKDAPRAVCISEIADANELCRRAGVRLFVNDHWQIACDQGAYGIHLGQEDLDALTSEQLSFIQARGLRLGVSTHSVEEAARALALRPSYIALGPIFPTTCKSMNFGPQGIERIREWKKMCGKVPLVAIGGLKREHAAALVEAGADGIAVVSDVLNDADPEQSARVWQKNWSP